MGGGRKLRKVEDRDVLKGTTEKITTGCGNLYVTINEDGTGGKDERGEPYELSARMGKSGGCAASHLEAIARMITLALQTGVSVEAIRKQLQAIRCPSPAFGRRGMVLSCPDAIAKALEKYLPTDQEGDQSDDGEEGAGKSGQNLVEVAGLISGVIEEEAEQSDESSAEGTEEATTDSAGGAGQSSDDAA